MKHFRRPGEGVPSQPGLLCEVRIDLFDVRSGFSGSETALFAGPWLDDPELKWPQDMVEKLQSSQIEECAPPRRLRWPESAEDTVITYVIESYRPRIWKHSLLGLYGQSSESREEFLQRCRDGLLQERNLEVQKQREIFLHRFLEIEQKLLESLESDDWEPAQRDRQKTRAAGLFSLIRDDFSRCFLRDDFAFLQPHDLNWKAEIPVEFQERLEAVKGEFVEWFNRLNLRFEALAARVESYEVPLSRSQVEVVSCAVLWS